jgi:hypothetical protein
VGPLPPEKKAEEGEFLVSVQEGVRFDMTPEEVIKYCQNHKGTMAGELK